MRTRERLIEVLRTTNPGGVGIGTAFDFLMAADVLEFGTTPPHAAKVRKSLSEIMQPTYGASPFSRELAYQAIQYLQEDANATA